MLLLFYSKRVCSCLPPSSLNKIQDLFLSTSESSKGTVRFCNDSLFCIFFRLGSGGGITLVTSGCESDAREKTMSTTTVNCRWPLIQSGIFSYCSIAGSPMWNQAIYSHEVCRMEFRTQAVRSKCKHPSNQTASGI